MIKQFGVSGSRSGPSNGSFSVDPAESGPTNLGIFSGYLDIKSML